MRDVLRNQQKVKYSLYVATDEKDKYGNKVYKYSDPVEGKFSLSPNAGEATNQPFGKNLDYDRQMLTHDMKCPIDENSHLWIDTEEENYNYIVKEVAKSLNCIVYAIKRVNGGK